MTPPETSGFNDLILILTCGAFVAISIWAHVSLKRQERDAWERNEREIRLRNELARMVDDCD